MKLIDLIGQKFGRLLVIKRHEKNDNDNKPRWICICDCGKQHITPAKTLRNGSSRSCGCLKFEIATNLRHGHSRRKNWSRTYHAWSGMFWRCNPSNEKDFQYYGGRGIIICDRWKKFDNFLADMGECPPKLELDRIDNNGNYEPGNCRWTDEVTQSRNRRNVQRCQKLSPSSKLE